MEDKSQIFRSKSMERVSSPEQLDKYIKTTSPALWILLLAIIVFLSGVIIWATYGKIEVSSQIGVVSQNNISKIYIKEEDYSKIEDDSYILINDNQYEITTINGPFEANTSSDSYLLHMADIKAGEWYYEIEINSNIQENQVSGKIVFERISPISFVIN